VLRTRNSSSKIYFIKEKLISADSVPPYYEREKSALKNNKKEKNEKE